MESHFPIPAGHQSAIARQRLMDDLSNLIADTELLLKATAGDVSEKVRETRERVRAGIERARTSLSDLQRRGAETAQQADAVIRDHPYESILAALAAGALVGVVVGHLTNRSD